MRRVSDRLLRGRCGRGALTVLTATWSAAMSTDVWRFPGAFASWPRPRLFRSLVWIGGVLAAIAVLGFLVLPIVLRPTLENSLSAALDRKVSIGKLQTN